MNEYRQSAVKSWLTCRRRFYLSYVDGWSEHDDSGIRGIGTLFHSFIAEYYGVPQPLNYHYELDDYDTAKKMFDTYVVEVEQRGLDVGMSTEFVERKLTSEVGGALVNGTIDHVYRDHVTSDLVLQDHKTVGAFTTTADRDFQLMFYAMLCHDRGVWVTAAEHNLVKRNKRTAQAKPPFIQRNRINLTVQAVNQFRKAMEGVVSDMVLSVHKAKRTVGVESTFLYPVGVNSCGWSAGCPFASAVCGMVDDGEDYSSVLHSEFFKKEAAPQ